MVEIEQEELERLKAIETAHSELQNNYNKLNDEHNLLKQSNSELKDDYIKLCKGQQQSKPQNEDDFDTLCSKKFDKK